MKNKKTERQIDLNDPDLKTVVRIKKLVKSLNTEIATARASGIYISIRPITIGPGSSNLSGMSQCFYGVRAWKVVDICEENFKPLWDDWYQIINPDIKKIREAEDKLGID